LFVPLLQVRDTIQEDVALRLFTVFCTLVWGLWILKVALSRRYRPYQTPFSCSTTVIIPVVDEPVDLFHEVLSRVVAQHPDEVIVIVNGPRNLALEQVAAEFPTIDCEWTPVAGKRNAVRVGVERAMGDVVVLLDSDTLWTEGTLVELVKPFIDPQIGGVTTAQRILDHRRSIITRWADWLENSRAKYSMPAQSVLGSVGCLPGRTIAFRRDVLERAMPAFLTERFLGVFLEVSDDRTLTNLALKQGYRTVFQSTSLVYTDAPLSWRKLSKQQLRWARGSQYNTLRMLPWMLRHTPVLALFFLADIVLPFLLLGAAIGAAYRVTTGQGTNYYTGFLTAYGWSQGLLLVVVLTMTATVLSMSIRQFRHLRERPFDLFWMPVFIIISSLFLMPIRLLGFFRMAHAGAWGTRKDAYVATSTVELPESPAPVGPRTGGGVALAERPVTSTVAVTMHRKFNTLAGVPYLIGLSVIAAEVFYRG
jgi:cellobiuronic acid synthase